MLAEAIFAMSVWLSPGASHCAQPAQLACPDQYPVPPEVATEMLSRWVPCLFVADQACLDSMFSASGRMMGPYAEQGWTLTSDLVIEPMVADPGDWMHTYARARASVAHSPRPYEWQIGVWQEHTGPRVHIAVSGMPAPIADIPAPTPTLIAAFIPAASSGRAAPTAQDCPATHPIKGNASSHIYHLPGQQAYAVTKPEDCFADEPAAQAAGYRRAQR